MRRRRRERESRGESSPEIAHRRRPTAKGESSSLSSASFLLESEKKHGANSHSSPLSFSHVSVSSPFLSPPNSTRRYQVRREGKGARVVQREREEESAFTSPFFILIRFLLSLFLQRTCCCCCCCCLAVERLLGGVAGSSAAAVFSCFFSQPGRRFRYSELSRVEERKRALSSEARENTR